MCPEGGAGKLCLGAGSGRVGRGAMLSPDPAHQAHQAESGDPATLSQWGESSDISLPPSVLQENCQSTTDTRLQPTQTLSCTHQGAWKLIHTSTTPSSRLVFQTPVSGNLWRGIERGMCFGTGLASRGLGSCCWLHHPTSTREVNTPKWKQSYAILHTETHTHSQEP